MSFTGPYPRGSRVPPTGYPYSRDESLIYRSIGIPSGPLPYRKVKSSANEFWVENTLDNRLTSLYLRDFGSISTKSYDRFWKNAGKRAEGLVNIAEAEKSMLMLAKRTRQVYDILRSASRGDIGGVARGLNLTTDDVRRRFISPSAATKKAAGSWLEYNFGWKPIIQDCATAIDILQREFDYDRTRGTGNSSADWNYNPQLLPGQSDYKSSGKAKIRFTCSGQITVPNPNLYLANQLGFVNPGRVVWDLVPFSFVIDWFLPVGAFLNSFTNDYGLVVNKPCSNYSVEGHCVQQSIEIKLDGSTVVSDVFNASSFTFDRSLALPPRPGIASRFHIPDASVWLALTSSSLMVQQIHLFKKG